MISTPYAYLATYKKSAKIRSVEYGKIKHFNILSVRHRTPTLFEIICSNKKYAKCVCYFNRKLREKIIAVYSWTSIIWTSVIRTCFLAPAFFMNINFIRCDLEKLKRIKVQLSFRTCVWNTVLICVSLWKSMSSMRYRGYYMAAQGYEFYLLVLKVSLTHSLRSLVRDTFSTRR